ncbi:MAG TPA: M64 family metallopeptidase [Vicinamibacterales bacterium]
MTPPRHRRGWRTVGLLVAAGLALMSGRSLATTAINDHLAGPPVIIHGTGSADTLKVVILGDGFTADDASLGAYREAADRLAAELLATDPFAVLSTALTIYRFDVISDEPGIDVPTDCGGEPYDTPPMSNGQPFPWSRSAKSPANILDTHWCGVDAVTGASKKQFLASDTEKVVAFASEAGVIPDMTIVLVNDWMFGATAFPGTPDQVPTNAVMFVSISQNLVHDVNPDTGLELEPNDPTSFPAVAVHEFGHLVPFQLVDEYSKNRPQAELAGDLGEIDASPNLSTALSPLKWESLVAPGTARPTNCEDPNPPEVGAAEGGYGFNEDVYRSRCECRMKDWSHATFCIVCRQRVFDRLSTHLPLLSYVPPPNQPASPVPPIRNPADAWVILDELAVKSGASGWYSVEYVVSVDGPAGPGRTQSVSGQWPRDRRLFFQRGQTMVIDDLLAVVPGAWLGSSSKLRFGYRLIWLPRLGDGVGPPSTVAQEYREILLARVKTTMAAFNRPTHRLTLVVVSH